MVIAYIMVKTHVGDADRIRDEIKALSGVIDVQIVAGDVDLIAKLDVDSPEAVKEIAADNIYAIDGVDTTKTYMGMD